MSSKVETLTTKPSIMITYCLTVFPLTPNTWLWLTLNPDFVLNCVLRQHVWSSEAWPLSKLGSSYTCSECCWRTSTEKNTCGIARFPCGSTAFLFTSAAEFLTQKKCEMYWPENTDTPIQYGDVTVSLVEVRRFGDYIQRTMNVRHSVTNTINFKIIFFVW